MTSTLRPTLSDTALAELAFAHLQHVVAIDSQSDERSTTLPTTDGQRILAAALMARFGAFGLQVECDAFSNVIASMPGKGRGARQAAVAMLVHLDTARGTDATSSLRRLPRWDGSPVPYPKNAGLRVDTKTYPAARPFLGHELVHGDGVAPFGLDDKLGLAEMLSLAELLAGDLRLEHPPLIFVARPDEEVGRDEALLGVADHLASRGVHHAYTIDGILPFEINLENFNAAMVSVRFAGEPIEARGAVLDVFLGGVNTHGATAAAEGHRAGPRLIAEWAALCPTLRVLDLESDKLRDCDLHARVEVTVADEGRARSALAQVMEDHLPRGASFRIQRATSGGGNTCADAVVRWLQGFYASNPGFTLPCEASEERDGYSHPMRVRRDDGGLRIDVRVRDFDRPTLDRRIEHLRALAPWATVVEQYSNMGPRLAAFPELLRWARVAAEEIAVAPPIVPIRGGTGVGPFLDRGIGVANLGTGYFSPESEKEFTSMENMAQHVRWLFALVQVIARES